MKRFSILVLMFLSIALMGGDTIEVPSTGVTANTETTTTLGELTACIAARTEGTCLVTEDVQVDIDPAVTVDGFLFAPPDASEIELECAPGVRLIVNNTNALFTDVHDFDLLEVSVSAGETTTFTIRNCIIEEFKEGSAGGDLGTVRGVFMNNVNITLANLSRLEIIDSEILVRSVGSGTTAVVVNGASEGNFLSNRMSAPGVAIDVQADCTDCDEGVRQIGTGLDLNGIGDGICDDDGTNPGTICTSGGGECTGGGTCTLPIFPRAFRVDDDTVGIFSNSIIRGAIDFDVDAGPNRTHFFHNIYFESIPVGTSDGNIFRVSTDAHVMATDIGLGGDVVLAAGGTELVNWSANGGSGVFEVYSAANNDICNATLVGGAALLDNGGGANNAADNLTINVHCPDGDGPQDMIRVRATDALDSAITENADKWVIDASDPTRRLMVQNGVIFTGPGYFRNRVQTLDVNPDETGTIFIDLSDASSSGVENDQDNFGVGEFGEDEIANSLKCEVDVTPGAGEDWTITIRSGAAGALSNVTDIESNTVNCVIDGDETPNDSCQGRAAGTVSAGEVATFSVVPSAAPAAAADLDCEIYFD